MTNKKTISVWGYTVNNLPSYALTKPYIVARYSFDKDNNASLWFYGAYDSEKAAYDAFEEIRDEGYLEFIVNK